MDLSTAQVTSRNVPGSVTTPVIFYCFATSWFCVFGVVYDITVGHSMTSQSAYLYNNVA